MLQLILFSLFSADAFLHETTRQLRYISRSLFLHSKVVLKRSTLPLSLRLCYFMVVFNAKFRHEVMRWLQSWLHCDTVSSCVLHNNLCINKIFLHVMINNLNQVSYAYIIVMNCRWRTDRVPGDTNARSVLTREGLYLANQLTSHSLLCTCLNFSDS